MKKINYVLLGATAMLSLVGCKAPAKNALPSGGRKLNLTVEADKKEAIDTLTKNADATMKDLKNVGIEASLLKTNIHAYAEADADLIGNETVAGKKAKAELTIKDAQGSLFAKAMNINKTEKQIIAHAGLKGAKGTISASATLPCAKRSEDVKRVADYEMRTAKETVKIDDIDINAYKDEKGIYVDASDKGIVNTLKSIDNAIVDVQKNMFNYDDEDLDKEFLMTKFDGLLPEKKIFMAEEFDDEEVILPVISEETYEGYAETIVEFVASAQAAKAAAEKDAPADIMDLLNGVNFYAYKDGRFGVEAAINKDGLKTAVDYILFDGEGAEVLDEYFKSVNEFEFSLYVLFNKNGLLDTIGSNLKVEVKDFVYNVVDDGEKTVREEVAPVTKEIKGSLSINTGFKIVVSYNDKVKVTLPTDLATYKVLAVK